MYRNISYGFDDNWNGQITLRTWDKHGNRITIKEPHRSFVTYEVQEETDLKSIYDTNLERRYFNSIKERNGFANSIGLNAKIFEKAQPEIEYLHQKFYKDREKASFAQFPLKVHFFDIEIAVENSFPEPTEAKYPINLITVYDSETKHYFTWAITDKPCKAIKENATLYICKTERELLLNYLNWHYKNPPDILSGWNSLKFDVPYIYNRSVKLLGEEDALLFSPDLNIYLQEKVDFRSKETWHKVHLRGLSHLDYLYLYRDKFLIPSSTGYSLGQIAQNELGISKLELDDKMHNIWKTDFQQFYNYNIRDVELLIKLDEKLQLLDLSRTLCNLGLCPYEKIYGSIAYLINNLSLYSKNKTDKVFPTALLETEDSKDYRGAFVYEAKPGYFDNGCATVDLNSLYPNVTIALNLSPETKVGKLIKDNNTYLFSSGTKVKEIEKEKIKKLLNEKCSISQNNILFVKAENKEGVVPGFLKYYYAQRKESKVKWAKLKKKIAKCTDENELKLLEVENSRFAIKDWAFKATLNSIYGMFGSKYSPIYDTDLAEAITLTSQFITKSAISFINQEMESRYNQKNSVVGGDTDSCAADSTIRTNKGIFTIEDFWNINFMSSRLTYSKYGHEIIPIKKDFKVLTFDENINKPVFNEATKIIRRKVKKEKYKINCGGKSVIVTGDHSCMVIRDKVLIEVKARDIKSTDKMVVLVDQNNYNVLIVNVVEKLDDFNDEYVYDIEMATDPHTFFANDILVHNSVFFILSGLVNKYLEKFNKQCINELTREEIVEICKELDLFVDKDLNQHCRDKVAKHCFTKDSVRINFTREIFAEAACFFKKKHYFMYVKDKEGIETNIKNAFKYAGISVKKNEIAPTVKNSLREVFERSVLERWTNEQYFDYISKLWEKFKTLNFDEISFYKGFYSNKMPTGFLENRKGATAVNKAVNYYHQLLKTLKIDDKYPQLVPGNKVRFCYTKKNSFGIESVAFGDIFPKEFEDIFTINYTKMFQKQVIKPLEQYCELRGWNQFNPKTIAYNDLFEM